MKEEFKSGNDELLTVAEAAKFDGVTVGAIYGRIKRGTLGAIQTTAGIRVSKLTLLDCRQSPREGLDLNRKELLITAELKSELGGVNASAVMEAGAWVALVLIGKTNWYAQVSRALVDIGMSKTDVAQLIDTLTEFAEEK